MRMLKKASIAILVLTLTAILSACGESDSVFALEQLEPFCEDDTVVWKVSGDGIAYDTYYLQFHDGDANQYVSFVLPKNCAILTENDGAPWNYARDNDYHCAPFALLHSYHFDISENELWEDMEELSDSDSEFISFYDGFQCQYDTTDNGYWVKVYGDRKMLEKGLYYDEDGSIPYALREPFAYYSECGEHGNLMYYNYCNSQYGWFSLAIDDLDYGCTNEDFETVLASISSMDDSVAKTFFQTLTKKGTDGIQSHLLYDRGTGKILCK
ncbi:MAG: hypothetical protein ACI4F8_08505 [Lachnospiraceae bacterium]